MKHSVLDAFNQNFLGHSPKWYKNAIWLFLIINPFALFLLGPTITGWLLVLEFIFTLAMALHCYPLQPGGLLALESVLLGMTSPEAVKDEIYTNFPVILLLMFMVAGIFFMKDLLLFTFTKILLNIRSKTLLSFLFCITSAVLSAFLDALTVTAVIISVALGFYSVYHKVASENKTEHGSRDDFDNFRAFLRSLLMHAAVGTALGGVCTTVGEPQNLLIAGFTGWDFVTFFLKTAPISMPVLVAGLITCVVLEKTKWFDFGHPLSDPIRKILYDFDRSASEKRTLQDNVKLGIQAITVLILVIALAFHLAEVGLIGLMIIVLQTAFNGITEEHAIGKAFEEALPFTALLVVFFVIVAVIHDQHLFDPVINWAFSLETKIQPATFFLATGFLSMVSDNVFVATVYISEIDKALQLGAISRSHFETLAVAINTGTNLPSVATPNGQAAFLFLLTSTVAPLVRLSYGKMVWMAIPYTIVLTIVGLISVNLFL